MRRLPLTAFATLCLALLAEPSQAQTAAQVSTARRLGSEGMAAQKAGRHEEALNKLLRAYAVVEVPSLAVWLARAMVANGRLVEASERYREATLLEVSQGSRAIQEEAKVTARRERQALLPRIPALAVVIEGVPSSETKVTLDRVTVPTAMVGVRQPTDPGKHVIEATWNGQVQRKEVTLAEGQKLSVTLTLDPNAQPAAAPPPDAETAPETPGETPEPEPTADSEPASNLPAWIGLGVGGAGLLFAGVTTLMTTSARSDAEKECGGSVDPCTIDSAASRDAVDSYNSVRGLPLIGLGVGVVGIGVGLTLLLTADKPAEQHASVSAFVGYRSAGLKGRF